MRKSLLFQALVYFKLLGALGRTYVHLLIRCIYRNKEFDKYLANILV